MRLSYLSLPSSLWYSGPLRYSRNIMWSQTSQKDNTSYQQTWGAFTNYGRFYCTKIEFLITYTKNLVCKLHLRHSTVMIYTSCYVFNNWGWQTTDMIHVICWLVTKTFTKNSLCFEHSSNSWGRKTLIDGTSKFVMPICAHTKFKIHVNCYSSWGPFRFQE